MTLQTMPKCGPGQRLWAVPIGFFEKLDGTAKAIVAAATAGEAVDLVEGTTDEPDDHWDWDKGPIIDLVTETIDGREHVEATGPAEPVEPPRQPVGYYCRRCKSDNLRWDAWAAYDPASQQMELADDFDYVICCSERCDGNETSIVTCEIALDEHGNATRGKAIEGEFDDDKAAA